MRVMPALTHRHRLEVESGRIPLEPMVPRGRPVMLLPIGEGRGALPGRDRVTNHPSTPPFPPRHVTTEWMDRTIDDGEIDRRIGHRRPDRSRPQIRRSTDIVPFQRKDCSMFTTHSRPVPA